MKPGSTIKVRYQKLGREGVLGLADLDTGEIIIDPRQLNHNSASLAIREP